MKTDSAFSLPPAYRVLFDLVPGKLQTKPISMIATTSPSDPDVNGRFLIRPGKVFIYLKSKEESKSFLSKLSSLIIFIVCDRGHPNMR